MDQQSFSIYWAGGLFDFKELSGNYAMAAALKTESNGRFLASLPQNSEANELRGTDIRDRDLEMLFRSDLVVANFDGTDLDSGTVMEFAFAKMLDIPSVLLRTDFRHSGDQSQPDADPWNLMCSGYPRTRSLAINGMALYHRFRPAQETEDVDVAALMHSEIARRLCVALNEVTSRPSLFRGSREKARKVYRWAVKSCGGEFRNLFTDSVIDEVIERKFAAGLLD